MCYSEVVIEDYVAQKRGKEGFFKMRGLAPGIIIFFSLMVGLAITQTYAAYNLEEPYQGIFSRPLWEWMLFITSFYEVYSFALFLPEYIPVEIDYRKYIRGLLERKPEVCKQAIHYNPYLHILEQRNEDLEDKAR